MQLAERRTQRSANQSEALQLLLEACRARAGLAALVIADHDGLLVSSSRTCALDPNIVAAHLPRTYWRERLPSLRATTLKLGRTRLFFGAIGEAGDAWAREILHAMRGARRILG
jgi:hypothetical protein